MKIYRVHLRHERGSIDAGNSAGYRYFTNKREAWKAFREVPVEKVYEEVDFQEINIEISKDGILHALNLYAGHPDNG